MKDLIENIQQLNKDNYYIIGYIDKNVELLKDLDSVEEINKRNVEFYSFLNEYSIRNNDFRRLMLENNVSTIEDIQESFKDNPDILTLLKEFTVGVKEAATKISLYRKLLSSEMNMVNKIKNLRRSSKIDFKI